MSFRRRVLALVEWIGLGTVVGVVCGCASALFLWALEWVTRFRTEHESIVFMLPVVGLFVGWTYERFGRSVKAGNDLVIDTIHDEGAEIPLRMAPMVLVGTVFTHLVGGSAGREGTAVQMGASLADAISHRLRLRKDLRKQLLAAGVAGGFGSVFGTPVAGAVFGLEFVICGQLQYHGLVPALVASIVGDMTTRAFGVGHAAYPASRYVPLTSGILLRWLVFAAAIALVTTVFVELIHVIKKQGEKRCTRLPVRMMLGGILVVALWRLIGTSDYLGLGVPTILRAFADADLPVYAFAAKLLFTVVTLGAGFLGGEVTPLFFIGATLGNVLARMFGIPLELGAGVGMAAAFASASNCPLALSVMAVELLGGSVFPHVAIVCVLSYVLSGHRSIYPAQRLFGRKGGGGPTHVTSFRDLRAPSPGREHGDDRRP